MTFIAGFVFGAMVVVLRLTYLTVTNRIFVIFEDGKSLGNEDFYKNA